jgi:hypothetical protein
MDKRLEIKKQIKDLSNYIKICMQNYVIQKKSDDFFISNFHEIYFLYIYQSALNSKKFCKLHSEK